MFAAALLASLNVAQTSALLMGNDAMAERLLEDQNQKKTPSKGELKCHRVSATAGVFRKICGTQAQWDKYRQRLRATVFNPRERPLAAFLTPQVPAKDDGEADTEKSQS